VSSLATRTVLPSCVAIIVAPGSGTPLVVMRDRETR
jgi:hypothetical protein